MVDLRRQVVVVAVVHRVGDDAGVVMADAPLGQRAADRVGHTLLERVRDSDTLACDSAGDGCVRRQPRGGGRTVLAIRVLESHELGQGMRFGGVERTAQLLHAEHDLAQRVGIDTLDRDARGRGHRATRAAHEHPQQRCDRVVGRPFQSVARHVAGEGAGQGIEHVQHAVDARDGV